MTARAGDAHRLPLVAVKESLHAHYGIELEQRNRDRGIVQINRVLAQSADHLGRKSVHVHLQPHTQRGFGAESPTFTAEARALNGAVQLKGATPEGLVAEGVEPERLAARCDRAL